MQYVISVIYCLLASILTVSSVPTHVFASSEVVDVSVAQEVTSESNIGEVATAEQAVPEVTPSTPASIQAGTNDRPETSAPVDSPSAQVQVEPQQSSVAATPLAASSTTERLIVTEIKLRSSSCDSQGKCTETKDGSFVELYNPSPDPVVLNGWKVQYFTQSATNFSTPTTELATLSNGTVVGEGYIVVGINVSAPAGVPVVAMANAGIGSKSDGYIRIVTSDNRQTDLVSWGRANAEGARTFTAPAANISVQRCEQKSGGINEETGFAEYQVSTPGVGVLCEVPEPPPLVNTCSGLVLSEIAANTEHQFIEVYNANDVPLDVTGCQVQTNRSQVKSYVFGSEIIEPYAYKVIGIANTELVLTKTTSGAVYVLSSDGQNEVDVSSYSNLASSTSWSRIDGEWRQTFAVTPGAMNMYQQFVACSEGYERNAETGRCNKVAVAVSQSDCGDGKYRSEETGRCRNIPAESILAACKLGQYRSEETNRCRNLATASALKACRDDQYRSEETNRCRNIATASANLKPCKENQYRSEETNRCRNISAKAVPSAAYAVQPVKDNMKAFVGWWALGGVLLLASGYAAWEWRYEVRSLAQKAVRSVRRNE